MSRDRPVQNRRLFMQYLVALGAAAGVGSLMAAPATAAIKKAIPATGELLPVIGMGSWITFDVEDERARATRAQVLQAFFDRGGALIDSSPMYGASLHAILHASENRGLHQLCFMF